MISQPLKNLKVDRNELLEKFNNCDSEKIYNDIKKEATNIIDKIDFPNYDTQDSISLIILYLFKGKLIHKDDVSFVISNYLSKKQTDVQVRHLSTQRGLHILNKGDKIPDTEYDCPSGYHMLISLNYISPRFVAIKRADILGSEDWDKIKEAFNYSCAHCNSKENEENFRDRTKTKLTKGHKDPNKSPSISNMIPLCNYCNRTYRDLFILSDNGAIKETNIKSINVAKKLYKSMVEIYGLETINTWSI